MRRLFLGDDAPGRVHPGLDEQLALPLMEPRRGGGHKVPRRLRPVGVYGVGRNGVGHRPEPTQVQVQVVATADPRLPRCVL